MGVRQPKTLRLSRFGVLPIVLHRHLRDLVAAYNVIPTFCAPRSGNQKGSVERLVGFTKRSFLFARKFKDRADLEAQLAAWLHEINHVRKCDATGVIPEVARQEELRWLRDRPVQCLPAQHAIVESAVVAPTGTISVGGTPYFASARRIGAPAPVLIRKDTMEIVVGDNAERCVHTRRDGAGVVRRLPGQREDLLAVVHGRRKQATFRRQCLLEVGQEAWSFLGLLVHRCPQDRWEGPCAEFYDRMTLSPHIDLDALLKRLCLATVARVFTDFEARAAAESWTPTRPPTSYTASSTSAASGGAPSS